MSLAKGTLSHLVYCQEASFNADITAGGLTGQYLSFISEQLGGNVNSIISEEIRADRAVSSMRGGNIATSGSVTTEFGPFKNGMLLKHAMGLTTMPAATDMEASIPTFAVSKYYDRGQIVKSVAGATHCFICTQGGLAAATPAALTTDSFQTHGATTWRLIGAFSGIGAVSKFTFTPHTASDGFIVPGLMLEKQIVGGTSNIFAQFTGCRVGGFNMSLPQEGLARADWNIIAMRQHAISTTRFTGTPGGPSTDQPFIGTDCVVYLASGGAAGTQIGGSGANYLMNPLASPYDSAHLTPRPVREGSVSFNNQFDESVFTIGDRYRRETPPGVRQVSGTLTTYLEDDTELEAFLGETEVTLEFCMIVGTKMMVIRLPYCRVSGNGTPTISGPGVLTASYNFTAYKGGTEDDIRIDIWGLASDSLV